MSDQLPNDWISAHFDGELSADEATLAERRLNEDDAARDEFEAYANLRELMGALPEHTLPSGFSTAVMRQCERQMLLPAAEGSGNAKSTGSWRPVLAGLLSTVAVVFLIVRVATTPADRHPSTSDDAPTGEAVADRGDSKRQPADRDNSVADNRKADAAGAPGPAGARPLQSAVRSIKQERARDNVRDETKTTAKDAIAAKKPIEDDQKALAKFRPGIVAGMLRKEQQAFHVGDVVPYLEVQGERTAVIEVTVVDVQRAMGRLEVLLAKQAIGPGTDSPHAKKTTGTVRRQLLKPNLNMSKQRGRQRKLVAVYVESSRPQFAAVMAALGKQTGAVHLSLKPPVEFGHVRASQIAQAEQAGVKKADGADKDSPQSFADAVAFARRMAAASPADKRKMAISGPGSFGGASPGAKDEDAKKKTAKDARKPPGNQAKRFKRSAPATAKAKFKAEKSQAEAKRDRKPAAGEKSKSTPSFRMWLALDEQPNRRFTVRKGENRTFQKAAARTANEGKKAANAKKSAPEAAPYRVMIVLRQQAGPVKANKP